MLHRSSCPKIFDLILIEIIMSDITIIMFLSDTNPLVDRSLQDKQRQLKRFRLQDNLRELLACRPGPMDLINMNILQLESQHGIDRAFQP